MRQTRFRFAAMVVGAALLVVTAVCARAEDSHQHSAEHWRKRGERMVVENRERAANAADPLTMPMMVCHDTACAQVTEVRLNEDEARMIRAGFGDGTDSPATERAMIAHAIAQFETFVGAQNGTWRDHARNSRNSEDEGGQMDCVSESINTLTYLGRLSQDGLLTQHDIGGFVMRYVVVLQHVAVEVIEQQSGDSFVIDSWNGDNGEEPLIQPYGSWRWEFLV